jgi:putative tryptophan/tyrosine transport system substrate-binding protein
MTIGRRDLLAALGAAVASPIAARAQPAMMPVVGYLYLGVPELSENLVAAFRKGLGEAGFVEGRNVAIEYRFAHNDLARLPELAADLIRRRVAVIAAPGGPQAAMAAKRVTAATPIVFSTGVDPVQGGLVASLNRPGGNITGISSLNVELGAKRLGFLHEVLPNAKRFAALSGPTQEASTLSDLQGAASTIQGQIEVLGAGTSAEIDTAFATFARKQFDAALVNPNFLFDTRRAQLVTLAAYYRLPTMYAFREHVEAGGLMSYGSSAADRDRQVGVYVGRILKGEKPADLPVAQATKFELVINAQTAKLLGLTIPEGLLAIADEVVE